MNDDILLNEICLRYLSAKPAVAIQLYGTHLTEVSIPFTPIDKDGSLLKKVNHLPSSILRQTLQDILTADSLRSKRMKNFPLMVPLFYDTLSELIDLVNNGYQPVKTEMQYRMFLIRFQNATEVIYSINQILLYSARKNQVMSITQVERILQNATTVKFNNHVLKIQPKLEKFYNYIYFPFAQKWKKWIIENYLPLCKESLGLYQVYSYKLCYQACVQYYTGHLVTPEEIFNIGYRHVLLIRAKQEFLINSHFPNMTVNKFIKHHVKGQSNKFTSEQDMVEYVKFLIKIFDVQARKELELPLNYKTPKVIPISDKNRVLGWANAAEFYVNTSQWNVIPKSDMIPFVLHEAVPGHAMQLQFKSDHKCLETISFFPNVMEGIGLYAEECFEPTDILSVYSRLNYHIWRALRLVIDCGIHYKGWSLEKCLQFMTQYCFHDKEILKTEILRYANNPGQACSYYMGYIDIKNMEEQWNKKNYRNGKYDFLSQILKYSRYSMKSIAKVLGLSLHKKEK